MKIGVLRETMQGERRVALVPDAAARLISDGHSVVVERGAGSAAGFLDAAYEKAGATLAADAATLCAAKPDVIVKVRKPTLDEAKSLPKAVTLIALLTPGANEDLLPALSASKATALALELVPRITRAQSMDVLSSQSGVAGYKAVLVGAAELDKFLPMLTTAAGSIAPAKAFILGAGVAGLQAIATARRLGAVVSGFDVRAAAGEQVRSLGAQFVEPAAKAEGSGGYARAQTEEHIRQQVRDEQHVSRPGGGERRGRECQATWILRGALLEPPMAPPRVRGARARFCRSRRALGHPRPRALAPRQREAGPAGRPRLDPHLRGPRDRRRSQHLMTLSKRVHLACV